MIVQRRHREDERQKRHIDDQKVKRHGQGDGGHEPGVAPGRSGQKAVVLAERVQSIEHLHHHQHRHADGARAAVVENLAGVGVLALDARVEVRELAPGHLGPVLVPQVPPGVAADGHHAHVKPDHQVSEEHPAVDDRLVHLAGSIFHDVRVWLVEPESGGRQAVRHQVHPEQLHGNQRLGHAHRCREEDAHHLSDVGAHHVPDELLGVGKNGAALRNRLDDGCKVVVREHHVRGALGHRRARPHGNADVCKLERGRVVHAVARHGHHLVLGLEQLHQLALVGGLDA
mmetsp:Transcript_35412/g.67769  ORF Transcript_35412/g.67769 Transcript_35412/m.67769 type:complete len:286 (-) Transcript_35412:2175-3032(-)